MANYPTSALKRITNPANGSACPGKCVILYEKELLCAKPRIISPRPIAIVLVAPDLMANEKWMSVPRNLHHVMIRHSVNPTVNAKQYSIINRCCDMTMIHPHRRIRRSTCGHKLDQTVAATK